MKNIYRVIALLAILLSGCATNEAPTNKPGNDVSIAKVNEVQKKIASCVTAVSYTHLTLLTKRIV